MRTYSFLFLLLFLLVFSGCGVPGSADDSVRFVALPEGAIQPEAVRDADGIIHILFYKGDPAGGNLYYCTFSSETNDFSAPIRVNSREGSAVSIGTIRGGQLAIGKKGSVHVVWNGSDRASRKVNDSVSITPLLYARLDRDKKAFGTETDLIQQAHGLDGGSSIAADSQGNVYVAWHAGMEDKGEEFRRIWVRKSADDGHHFSDEKAVNLVDAGACGCCGMHLGVLTNNTVFGVYRSAKERKNRDVRLLLSSDGAASFTDAVVHPWRIESCPMSSMSSAVLNDFALMAWETDGKVYFKRVNEATAEILSPGSQRHGAKHPKISISANGTYLLAWTEKTGWSKGGDLAWELYDLDGKVLKQGRKEDAIPVWSFPAVVSDGKDGFLIF